MSLTTLKTPSSVKRFAVDGFENIQKYAISAAFAVQQTAQTHEDKYELTRQPAKTLERDNVVAFSPRLG